MSARLLRRGCGQGHGVRGRGRGRGDDGALILEMALVLPILLALVLGLLDFALYLIRVDTVENASRDAARTAILGVSGADGITSPSAAATCASANANYNRVCKEARARLAGTPISNLRIRCFEKLTGTLKTGGCAAAKPDEDSVEVSITWGYKPSTPIGATFIGTKSGKFAIARMVVQ
jgi:hypothetical protein